MTTLIVYVMAPGQPVPFVAWTTNVEEPTVVGVPDSTPPVVSVSPAGSAPLATENVKGPAPPLAVSVWEYGTPNVPLGIVAGEMTTTGHPEALMTMVYVIWAKHPFASVARIVIVEVPTVVGVPDRTPPAVSVSPAGRVPLTTEKV